MKATLTTTENETALKLIEEWVRQTTDNVGLDAYGYDVSPISSESYDGFIAFTDGGWDGIVTFGLHSEETYRIPLIAKVEEADYAWCREEFVKLHGITDEEVDDHDEWEDFRMEWEMNDDSCWFMKVRAIFYEAENRRNETGQDEVLLCVGINDDFNYGRDSVGAWAGNIGTHWTWERTIPLADVTPELLAECQAEALKAL